MVRAIEAAVSASMLSFVVYCSTRTSKRDSSSRSDRTSYLENTSTVDFSTSHGSASGVWRRFASPRDSASACQSSE